MKLWLTISAWSSRRLQLSMGVALGNANSTLLLLSFLKLFEQEPTILASLPKQQLRWNETEVVNIT
jgi:hypothetical protein